MHQPQLQNNLYESICLTSQLYPRVETMQMGLNLWNFYSQAQFVGTNQIIRVALLAIYAYTY